ncbi:MAG: DNA cytosine methyltransferase, partial [Lactobacillus johnsonii]|nr:DNA cytosine methyltransferase [Lactobacillus johnsonii]
MADKKFKFADLFAGAGGFTVGFKQAGYKPVKAVEFDASIAETYKKNNPSTKMLVDDIKNVDQTNEFKFHDVDIIVGGPPCQGFSMAGA